MSLFDGSGGTRGSPADVSLPNPALGKSVMPVAVTHEEASGSRSKAKRQRSESSEARPSPALRRGSKHTNTASAPMTRSVTRARRVSQSALASSEGSLRRRSLATRGKMANPDRICGEEEGRREEEEEEVSSTPSSPLREPYIPGEESYSRMKHPMVFSAFEPVIAKFREKEVRQMQLPTLEYFKHFTCLNTVRNPELLSISQHANKAARHAAKSIIRISSSIGGEPLRCCSGFWVDWDKQNNTGIILTTAHLICSKETSSTNAWLCKDQYLHNAKVSVHLVDGTTVEGHIIYYQRHYNIAFLRATVDQPVQLPFFDGGVECGKEILQLGRDENLNLKITYGRTAYWNPNLSERYHFLYFSREDDVKKDYDNGGPVIDLHGTVVGMVNHSTRGSFIPSSILLKCLHIWKNYGCIPRPHLGLKFSAIELLDAAHADKIWRRYKIDVGLIVIEVSEGSPAEKVGIRTGDVVECLNGQCISTTIELENALLSISMGCLDRGDGLDAVDVSLTVFHVRKHLRRIKTWTVNLSDNGDFVSTAAYPFASAEEISNLASSDHVDSGNGWERPLD